MNKSKIILAAVFAVLVAVPTGAMATWSSYGTTEPDAWDDTSFMQSDVPSGAAKIYFNAWSTSAEGGIEGYNPNVGALDTHFEQMGNENNQAVLGVWTDCNGDGYIGLAETGAREYDSRLLGVGPNANKCPAAPVGPDASCWTRHPGAPCPNWPATGYNNYRGIVTELIPIVGPGVVNDGTRSLDARMITDMNAAVWMDAGRPNDDGGVAFCPTTPPPRGTLQSTGGALTYVSCRTELIHDLNFVGDTAGVSQLQFSDESNGRSAAIGQVDTFGQRWDDPNRNNDPETMTVVKAQDCDQPYIVKWTDVPVVGPTLASELATTTTDKGVRPPALGDTNPNDIASGKTSVAGTLNYTWESAPLNTRQTASGIGAASTSNCDFSDDRGDEPYNLVEGDNAPISGTQKAQSTLNYHPRPETRGFVTGTALGAGPTGASGDDGIQYVSGANPASTFDTHWFATTLIIKTPTAVANRGGLSPDHQPNAGLADAYNTTSYARVGSDSTSVAATAGGSGKYGSAQCGSFTSGIHHGWDCDAAHWNLNPDGSAVPPNGDILSHPGLDYQFRDQDCYDGSIGQTGIAIGVAFFGPRPCSDLNS